MFIGHVSMVKDVLNNRIISLDILNVRKKHRMRERATNHSYIQMLIVHNRKSITAYLTISFPIYLVIFLTNVSSVRLIILHRLSQPSIIEATLFSSHGIP